MTPEEMAAALGPGWMLTKDGPTGPQRLVLPGVSDGMEVWEYGGEWFVEVGADHHRRSYYWGCPTREAAVAVAHLLVAAERVAAGAALGDRPPKDAKTYYARAGDGVQIPTGTVDIDHTIALGPGWKPSHVRAFALDLLRAADEAEEAGR